MRLHLSAQASLTGGRSPFGPGHSAWRGRTRMADAMTVGLRLARLRCVLRDRGLDAMLLVPGVDGRDNLPARQVLGWALLGRSGSEALEGSRLPEPLEDCFFVLRPSSLDVYCPPAARRDLQLLSCEVRSCVRGPPGRL